MNLDWLAPTILAAGSLIGSIVAAVISYKSSQKVTAVDAKVDIVKKATDGMTTALVANEKAKGIALVEGAAEKGRAEGAALATAGAAAASATPATPPK